MKPKVGFDARFALAERRGIGNYSLELFKALAAQNQEFEFVFYADRPDTDGLLSGLPNSQVRVLRPGIYPIWEQVILPIALLHDRIDLFHAVGNTAPFLPPFRTRLVVTVHDVMFLKDRATMPLSRSWYQLAGRAYRWANVPIIARLADALITVSEFSAQDILASIPGVPRSKVIVTWQGLPASFRTPPEASRPNPLPEGGPFLLHLAGLDPRKNTAMVIRRFLAMKERGELQERLVILGLSQLCGLGLTPEEMAHQGAWIHLPGFVPEADIASYYEHASALLFPSLYEGFGIPLLEAMACGTPIITSGVTSLPEIAGPAALYVDPREPEDLEAAIRQLLASEDLRKALRHAGRRRVQDFAWSAVAERTMGCYLTVLGRQN